MFSMIKSDIVITRSNATWFSVRHCSVWSRTQIRCFDKFVAWLTRFWPWVKTGIGCRWYWPWFAWFANWMGWKLHWPPSARAARCASLRKVSGPTQSARIHAKRADPRKARGLRYECAGRQVRGSSRNAWAAVQLRAPHWVRGPQLRGEVSGPHYPRTSPAPVMQCPRNATTVPLACAAIARHVKG